MTEIEVFMSNVKQATISIRREGSLGMFVKYKVLIDGVQVGDLNSDAKAQFTVVPGSHIVQVKLRSELSQPLTIDIQAGEVIELVCGQDSGKVWSLSQMTIPLYLHRTGVSNNSASNIQSSTEPAVRLLGEDNVVYTTTIIDVEEYPLDNRLGTDNLSVELEISKTVSNEVSLESNVDVGATFNVNILSMLQAEISTNISKKYGHTVGQIVSRRQMLQFTVKAGSFVTYIITWRRKVRTGNYIVSIGNQSFSVPYRIYYDLSYEISTR